MTYKAFYFPSLSGFTPPRMMVPPAGPGHNSGPSTIDPAPWVGAERAQRRPPSSLESSPPQPGGWYGRTRSPSPASVAHPARSRKWAWVNRMTRRTVHSPGALAAPGEDVGVTLLGVDQAVVVWRCSLTCRHRGMASSEGGRKWTAGPSSALAIWKGQDTTFTRAVLTELMTRTAPARTPGVAASASPTAAMGCGETRSAGPARAPPATSVACGPGPLAGVTTASCWFTECVGATSGTWGGTGGTGGTGGCP